MFLMSEVFGIEEYWLFEGGGNMYLAPDLDAVERDRQRMQYYILRDRLLMFSMQYNWMAPVLSEDLKDAKDFDPELCPPELLEQMRKVLKIPEGELFPLLRERFLAWGGDREELEGE